MKHALVIKTDMILKPDVMKFYHDEFVKQLKSGVVIIPAFFEAELLNVPTDVDVFIESEDPESGRKYF